MSTVSGVIIISPLQAAYCGIIRGMDFEDNLKALEELVAKMESGELKLDDMIKAFEEGKARVEQCQKELAAIRQRIEKATQSGGVEPLAV